MSNMLSLRRPPTAASSSKWRTAATDLKDFLSLFARASTGLILSSETGKNRNLRGESGRTICKSQNAEYDESFATIGKTDRDCALTATAATALAVSCFAIKLFLPKASTKMTRLQLI